MTPDQVEDLVALKQVIAGFGSDLVIVGATAYRAFVPGILRYTEDIDVAIALDLDNLDRLEFALTSDGWTRDTSQEPSWRGPRKSRIDILPAGPNLRSARQLTWPRSGMAMSLVGFDHVFERAVEMEAAVGTRVRVTPPDVLFLLKMVSYLDSPEQRDKDIADIHGLLRRYECDSDRMYSNAVADAQLSDFEFYPAFLLGMDLATFCDAEEDALVKRFLSIFSDPSSREFAVMLQYEGPLAPIEERLSLRLSALRKGLNARQGPE